MRLVREPIETGAIDQAEVEVEVRDLDGASNIILIIRDFPGLFIFFFE
jgi:hypothetical protein